MDQVDEDAREIRMASVAIAALHLSGRTGVGGVLRRQLLIDEAVVIERYILTGERSD